VAEQVDELMFEEEDRMAKPNAKRPRPNLQPTHPSSSDDESWKVRPSTETTGDEGHNARLIREHRKEENSPTHGPAVDDRDR
jgi:hypothetical protein